MVGDLNACDEKAMEDMLSALEASGYSEAIATDCRLLSDPDLEVARVAMGRLQWLQNRITSETDGVVITQSTLECLRANLFVPEPINRGVLLAVFVNAALMNGEHDLLWKTVRVFRERYNRQAVYTTLWQFDSQRVRPVIERIMAEETDPFLRGLALRGLTSVNVPESGPENEAMCKILSQTAGDPSLETSEEALDGLGGYCPTLFPRFVEVITARQANRTLTRTHISALVSLARGARATPERQAEAAALLERLLLDTGLDGGVRSDALSAIHHADPQRARKLATRFRRDPDPMVATTADAMLPNKKP